MPDPPGCREGASPGSFPTPPYPERPRLSPLVTVPLALATFLVLRGATAAWGIPGLVVSQWVGLLGVPLLLLKLRGVSPGAAVGWRGIPPRSWLGSVALGVAGLPLAWTVFWLQERVIPVDPEVVAALNRELVPGGPGEFAVLLGAAVLTPAVCEEFVFRGLLQRGMADRAGPFRAVLAGALLFGLLHWVPGGGFRILPTVALGLLLGYTAWRSGSLLAAVTVHATHNFVILGLSAVAAWSEAPPAPEATPGSPPLPLLVAGVALAALGRQLLAPASGIHPTSTTDTARNEH